MLIGVQLNTWGGSSVNTWGGSSGDIWGGSTVDIWGGSCVNNWGGSSVDIWGGSSVDPQSFLCTPLSSAAPCPGRSSHLSLLRLLAPSPLKELTGLYLSSPPSAMVWKLSQGSNIWEIIGLTWFLSGISVLRCLMSSVLLHVSVLSLLVSRERVNLVPATPTWLTEEVLIPNTCNLFLVSLSVRCT